MHVTAAEIAENQAPNRSIRKDYGKVQRITAQALEISGLNHCLTKGDIIRVSDGKGDFILGEIITIDPQKSIAMMLADIGDISLGAPVERVAEPPLSPSEDWLGRVLNYAGQDTYGQRPTQGATQINLDGTAPIALHRRSLGQRLNTGIQGLDSFLPICEGQRVGLFAGSGVGKSTLLGMLGKSGAADVNIIALIGERGREVRHFVDHVLGPEGLKKTIVFTSTSDEPSAMKLRAAKLAMATAEYFRDQGKQVLFLFDSLTRYAEAHRDMALSAGETPSLRAYPPSTFRALASLCERAGPGMETEGASSQKMGDITAIFSVLVAGSNMEEPIADMVRGILDGHIILDREIAERGRYPAINIRRSVSRALPDCATQDENELLRFARAIITKYEESKNLIMTGMYEAGTDPILDKAIKIYPAVEEYLQNTQGGSIEETMNGLLNIMLEGETPHQPPNQTPEQAPESEREGGTQEPVEFTV